MRARLGVGDWVLLLGNVGGKQEVRSTQKRRLPVYEEGMVEGTRVILARGSKLRMGRDASGSEIKCLNRPASCSPVGKAVVLGGRGGLVGLGSGQVVTFNSAHKCIQLP